MVESDGTALVPSTPATEIVKEETTDMVVSWDRGQPAILTSIDRTSDIGKQYYLACFGTPTKVLSDVGDAELPVRDWFLHKVERLNKKTGELVPGLRLVLVLTDGRTIATSSGPFINVWYQVVTIHGRETFDPPLLITVCKKKGSGEGNYLQMASCKRAVAETKKVKEAK